MIDLYLIPASPPCRFVQMVARELNIQMNLINVDLLNGEHKKEEFTKLNPHQQVPVINDNGFILSESKAIVTYLVNKYSPGHPLYPTDPQTRANIDRMLYFNLEVFEAQKAVQRPIIYHQAPLDPVKLEAFKDKVRILDSKLDGRKFLVGNTMTLADLAFLSDLPMIRMFDVSLNEFKNLTNWLENLENKLPYYDEINRQVLQQFQKFLDDRNSKK